MKTIAALVSAAGVGCLAMTPAIADVSEGVHVIDVGGGARCAAVESALAEVAVFRKTDVVTPVEVRIAPGDYTPEKTLAIGKRHARKEWGRRAIRTSIRRVLIRPVGLSRPLRTSMPTCGRACVSRRRDFSRTRSS